MKHIWQLLQLQTLILLLPQALALSRSSGLPIPGRWEGPSLLETEARWQETLGHERIEPQPSFIAGNVSRDSRSTYWFAGRKRTVPPIDCQNTQEPLQVVGLNDAFEVRKLNIDTGEYSLMYSLPKSMTSPSYKKINAVGINPKDHTAYGMMKVGSKSYFIRFGEGAIEYLARMPQWGYAGAFDSKEDRYYYVTQGNGGELYEIEDVSNLQGHPTADGILDFREIFYLREFNNVDVADLVAADLNIAGTGVHKYLMGMHQRGGPLYLVNLSSFPEPTGVAVHVSNVPGGTPFGAGWNYMQQIYFAANEGQGVYHILMDTLDLTTQTVEAERVGPSTTTSKNDGMNCMEQPDPWQVLPVPPVDCKSHPEPMQVLENGNKYDVRKLNIETGEYDLVYDLPKSMTSPAYSWINAVGMNPIDGILYGLIEVEGKPYFARFGEGKIEFLALMPRFGYAGTFDTKEDKYYYVESGQGAPLYELMDTAKLKGHRTTDGVKDFREIFYLRELSSGISVSEIVMAEANIAGTGMHKYLMAVADGGGPFYIVNISAFPEPTVLSLDVSGLQGTFGAGWNYKGHVYFASNKGNGVYRVLLETVDLKAKTIQLERVGASEKTSKNDGVNCMQEEDPWVEPTTNATTNATTNTTTTTNSTTTSTTTVSNSTTTSTTSSFSNTTTNATTTSTTTSLSRERRVNLPCLPGFILQRCCPSEEPVKSCVKCSVRHHCNGHASSVSANSDGTACQCQCKDGWQGASCDIPPA